MRARAGLAIVLLMNVGCVGYDRVLFMTKTNIGVDVDSEPPTAEITIARREGVIAPTFNGGQVPPLMASFKLQNENWYNFGTVASTFAGGEAANTMSALYGDPYVPPGPPSGGPASGNDPAVKHLYPATIKLSESPNPGSVFDEIPLLSLLTRGQCQLGDDGEPPHWYCNRFPKPEEVRPLFFGTDTMFGLKAVWSGSTGAAPSTVKLGYNRKEFALAPMSLRRLPVASSEKSHQCSDTDHADACAGNPASVAVAAGYAVDHPSVLATIDYSVEVGETLEGKVGWLQYFATGDAATALSQRPEVRQAMLRRFDPEAADLESVSGTSSMNEPSGIAPSALFGRAGEGPFAVAVDDEETAIFVLQPAKNGNDLRIRRAIPLTTMKDSKRKTVRPGDLEAICYDGRKYYYAATSHRSEKESEQKLLRFTIDRDDWSKPDYQIDVANDDLREKLVSEIRKAFEKLGIPYELPPPTQRGGEYPVELEGIACDGQTLLLGFNGKQRTADGHPVVLVYDWETNSVTASFVLNGVKDFGISDLYYDSGSETLFIAASSKDKAAGSNGESRVYAYQWPAASWKDANFALDKKGNRLLHEFTRNGAALEGIAIVNGLFWLAYDGELPAAFRLDQPAPASLTKK